MIPETDLTTLESLKEWLPVPSTTTSDDATLSALISACSGDFLRATNRPDLLSATYNEVRQGDGGYRMVAYHWPIASIESLMIGSLAVPNSPDKIAAGFFVDEDIDPERVYNIYLNKFHFTDGAVVQINYTAGYVSVPPDIQQAVNDWVAFRYKQEPNLGQTESRSAEGESVEQSQVDAPANIRAVIERYMRRIPSVSRRYDEEQMRMQNPGAKKGKKR